MIKKIVLIMYMIFCQVQCTYVHAQESSTIKTFPISWMFESGTGFLTADGNIKNNVNSNSNNLGVGASISWEISLNQHKTFPSSGFIFAPGIGYGYQSLSINKNLTESNGQISIQDIIGNYDYSIIRGSYLDIPFDFKYITKSDSRYRSLSFEIGSKFGWLLNTEKVISTTQGNTSIIEKTKNSNILNKNRYGVNAKICFRDSVITHSNELFGLSLALIVNYYFSDVFIRQEDNSSKSFSIGLGLGFVFN